MRKLPSMSGVRPAPSDVRIRMVCRSPISARIRDADRYQNPANTGSIETYQISGFQNTTNEAHEAAVAANLSVALSSIIQASPVTAEARIRVIEGQRIALYPEKLKGLSSHG
jgi:hypothetical protein